MTNKWYFGTSDARVGRAGEGGYGNLGGKSSSLRVQDMQCRLTGCVIVK
jgi:hypothetical protein